MDQYNNRRKIDSTARQQRHQQQRCFHFPHTQRNPSFLPCLPPLFFVDPCGGRQVGSAGSEAMGSSSSAVLGAASGGGGGAGEGGHRSSSVRALAARTVTDSLRAAVAGSTAAEKVARFEECARSLEAEKAKMEVFRRELPISVHLIGDVIEWLKDEVEQHRRRPAAPELLVPSPSPAPPAKRKAAEAADASDKRSWMSSAQLWTCGSHSSNSNNGGAGSVVKKPAHEVPNAFVPLNGLPIFTKSSEKPEAATTMAVPDLSLSSPAAIDTPCPAAPSANSSEITDAGAQRQQSAAQQRKARRCWSPELHRRFVGALQRLGGPQAATPKQIREMMKVDGLTNDEVKSHLQKYRLHTRRASDGGSGDQQQAASGMWPPLTDQYTTSQQSTSQSGSPQGPLQFTVSSRAMSVTAADSCEGVEEEEEEDGKSASYHSWEENGTKASST